MKKLIYILLFCFSALFVSCGSASDSKNDKFESEIFTKEAEDYVDRLGEYSTKDMKSIEHITKQKDYSFWENIFTDIESFMRVFFIILIVVILAVLFWIGYKKKYIKDNKEKGAKKYTLGLNTIEGHDWVKEISAAEKEEDWGSAIMLVYLWSLYVLNSKNLIRWNESKTPTEYYYELKSSKLKPALYNITMLYLRARYSNVEATAEMYNSALNEQKRIANGF